MTSTISYQIEYSAEVEAYIVYVFETLNTTTGEEFLPPYSVGPDFETRHDAEAFVRFVSEVAA
jgi:hypothetical protein